MKKGILQSILFFVIGFGVAGISFSVIGNLYAHAPGLHHLILFLTIVIALLWTLASLYLFIFKVKTQKLKGIIITNAIIILSCLLYVSIPIYLDSKEETFVQSDFIRTEIDRDTTKIYNNDNLIYIKVKDSVLLDLR